MEHARAWLRGSVPATPLARLIGYRPTQIGSGSATLTMRASPWLQFGNGIIDYGILAEEALGMAVLTGAPPATRVETAAISAKHFRPGTLDSESFVARARVLNSGSAFTVAEALVEDALGRAVGHITGSLLLRRMEPPPPAHDELAPADEPTYATPDPPLRPLSPQSGLFGEMRALEAMRKMLAGELPEPPLSRLLGLRLLEVSEDGSGAMSLPASPWFRSRWSDVQPGPIGTAMHVALSTGPFALATANQYLGVLSQAMTFLRSVSADGRELIARYRLAHRGDELLVSAVEIVDADGNRVAMGWQTSVLRDRRRSGAIVAGRAERVLATVLFTDIVGSTRRAQELGDERWRQLLAEHDAVVRRQLKTFQGREVKSIGDGFLVAFESPARAVQCARAIRDGVRPVGLEIRAGIHTGEMRARRERPRRNRGARRVANRISRVARRDPRIQHRA
jgi:class 3 adenylate cyclase